VIFRYVYGMRGGGHTNYVADPVKRAEWARQLADRTAISPEQLLGFFAPEWIHATDAHQRKIGSLSLSQLIESPLAKPKNEDEKTFSEFASNNIEVYSDDTEDKIYDDDILNQLLTVRGKYTGDEAYSTLVRVRRTIVAYFILSAQEDHSAA